MEFNSFGPAVGRLGSDSSRGGPSRSRGGGAPPPSPPHFNHWSYNDDRGSVDIIFLDCAKAVDKVPHRRLMSKLKAHGIDGRVADWISDWLDNRMQRVCINGVLSGWMLVTSGVPQGSVLGPLLFLIFINDLDLGLLSSILKFADDTKIYGKAATPADRLQLQLDLDGQMSGG